MDILVATPPVHVFFVSVVPLVAHVARAGLAVFVLHKHMLRVAACDSADEFSLWPTEKWYNVYVIFLNLCVNVCDAWQLQRPQLAN